jgi:hypothetical protein
VTTNAGPGGAVGTPRRSQPRGLACPPAPRSPEIQAVSGAYDAAPAQAEAKLEKYEQAKEAGGSHGASPLLAEGKAYNADRHRLSDELRRLRALNPGWQSERRPAPPEKRAAALDPLERLQKLADLHDRGVPIDSEFAAEKAKILNDG